MAKFIKLQVYEKVSILIPVKSIMRVSEIFEPEEGYLCVVKTKEEVITVMNSLINIEDQISK